MRGARQEGPDPRHCPDLLSGPKPYLDVLGADRELRENRGGAHIIICPKLTSLCCCAVVLRKKSQSADCSHVFSTFVPQRASFET